MLVSNISPAFNSYKNLSNSNSSQNTNSEMLLKNSYNLSFGDKGGSNFFGPLKKLADNATTLIAKGLAPVIDTKPCKWLFDKTKNCQALTSHLSAFTSLVLSGFYIGKTLTNDNLDNKKRRTLAINQGGTCVLSTISAYSLDKVLDRKINIFKNKFKAVNVNKPLPDSLGNYERGIRAAASIMIFGVMYRFVAPVLITPIANAIGNTLNEKEAQIKAKKANKLSQNA